MSAATAPVQSKALRRLFLTIFLRGRGARGLQKQSAPKSIGRKLALTLAFYALFGIFATMFITQGLYAVSIYLHASTMMFIGMFVASSAGEALFNKEEADILLHRPVTPQALLWAKVRVMVEISIWLAAAFNLVGFGIGTYLSPSRGMFVAAHAVSVVMDALFCTGLVVVTYQLCLRWFGREKLDGVITTAQTLMAIGIVLGSQLAPQVMMRHPERITSTFHSWWILCLPPAWFAGFDDAIAGSHSVSSLALGALAVASTAALLWVGFGTLARDYGTGLQAINETGPARSGGRPRRQFFKRLTTLIPFRWWIRHPVERASFLLCTSYLMRDRDVKLRVYPGITPMMMMPIIMLLPRNGTELSRGFMVAFAGAYLGMIPLLAVGLLKYSQNWQAADVFRAVPMTGPGPLYDGLRKAVLLVLTLPMLVILALIAWAMGANRADLLMLIPGVITIPVFALMACWMTNPVPFGSPAESARSAGRGWKIMSGLLISMPIAALSAGAKMFGYFWPFIGLEIVACAIACQLIQYRCRAVKWKPIDEDAD